jgi:L-threonylcarbamoyladenylate synthase
VPTETVYGLAARADREAAVAAIFRAKGRPDFNPLIVHVSSLPMARELAWFDERAETLAARYWPGPLTLVLPAKGSAVVPAVTAGLPTIALRMPDHPATRSLLAEAALPLAAPFGQPQRRDQPDRARARRAIARRRSRRDPRWRAVPARGRIDDRGAARGWRLAAAAAGADRRGRAARGPRPAACVGKRRDRGARPARAALFAGQAGAARGARGGCRRVPDRLRPVAGDCSLSEQGDLALAAARLYACLHLGAASDKPRIAVAPVPEEGIGAAINDRLRRAAA